jgi:hypothetical protein
MPTKILNNTLRSGCLALFIIFISLDILAQNDQANPLPQFLFPTFSRGTIVLKTGEKFNAILNYNMADEIMVSKLDNEYRSANNPSKFDTIYLQNRIFVPVENTFYELLVYGPATFYIQHRCSYTTIGSDIGYGAKSNSLGPTKTQRFEYSIYNEVVRIDLPPNVEVTPNSVYWVRTIDKMEKFNNEKQLLKLFPEKEAKLKEFIHRENLKVKDREDLIKIGNYCNTLLQ